MAKYVNADKMLKEYERSIYDTTDLAEMLYYMPAADVQEVKHGRWIEHKSKYFMKCSVCGALWDKDLTMNKYFNHCPRCGAKMDEAQGG